ncbi:MAG: IPExxxVDY family protein [Bacteroidia bacterium]
MSRIVLEVAYDYDFLLIGLVSHTKDYRLCYELNKKFDFDLQKRDNLEILINKRKETSVYSFYEYQNEDGDGFYLIGNKGSRSFLIPEQKQLDYFLVIKQLSDLIDEKNLIKDLKTIPLLLGAFSIDPKGLKSKENLIF